MVSVDVISTMFTYLAWCVRAQELCKSRGGRPGEIKRREALTELDCLLLHVSTVAFRTLSLRLCSAQLVDRAITEAHKLLIRSG